MILSAFSAHVLPRAPLPSPLPALVFGIFRKHQYMKHIFDHNIPPHSAKRENNTFRYYFWEKSLVHHDLKISAESELISALDYSLEGGDFFNFGIGKQRMKNIFGQSIIDKFKMSTVREGD